MTRPALNKRFFARFMAASDDLNYRLTRDKKKILFDGVQGNVLEIGPGTGVNFRFWDASVHWTGVEPNPAMHDYLRRKASEYGFDVNLVPDLTVSGGLKDGTFDFVVSTLVLCSVPDVDAMLRDVRRVLKPGGKYIFLEHVVDKKSRLRRAVQNALPHTPWRYFSDGCYPNRDIGRSIRNAGFSEVILDEYQQPDGGLVGVVVRPHIYGSAVN